ncbi:hypothetical protein APSETT445_009417 [Aspergillus pseudonomiae]
MILSLNGCFMHTEEARFENAHEESTHEHSSKVERRTLQKRNTAPTELKHGFTAESLQQQVGGKIKQRERNIENGKDNTVLVANQLEVFVNAISLRVPQITPIKGVEEVHQRKDGKKSKFGRQ